VKTFQLPNITHDYRNKYRISYIFIENTRQSLKNTVVMKYDDHSFIIMKTDCTNKFVVSKLSENFPFHYSYNIHDDRNNFQVTFALIENPGNSLDP